MITLHLTKQESLNNRCIAAYSKGQWDKIAELWRKNRLAHLENLTMPGGCSLLQEVAKNRQWLLFLKMATGNPEIDPEEICGAEKKALKTYWRSIEFTPVLLDIYLQDKIIYQFDVRDLCHSQPQRAEEAFKERDMKKYLDGCDGDKTIEKIRNFINITHFPFNQEMGYDDLWSECLTLFKSIMVAFNFTGDDHSQNPLLKLPSDLHNLIQLRAARSFKGIAWLPSAYLLKKISAYMHVVNQEGLKRAKEIIETLAFEKYRYKNGLCFFPFTKSMIKDFKRMIHKELNKIKVSSLKRSERKKIIAKIGVDRGHKQPSLKQSEVHDAIKKALRS